MLSKELIKKIRKIHFKSGRLVNTMMAGQYKSVFRGSGIEFEEVREYTPGDEVKEIDWKVSARLGKPFVKRFREERERVVMLLLDMSASGLFGTREDSKNDTAAQYASAIAFNAIKNNDRVGAILFTDRVEKYIPPKKGSSHVWRVIREFYTFSPQHRGTDIQSAVRYLGHVLRKKAVCFLISDFISSDYLQQLKIVSKKHEIIGVLLSDPGDFRLPEAGLIAMEDLETGKTTVVDASDARMRRAYERTRTEAYEKTRESLKYGKVDCIEAKTDGSVSETLMRYFRLREKRIRR
ncbi:MAG: DUF58 domain-containing protein [Desulfobacteraceae bacterium]|nr:DUF58 domain-containing protein [Pseudomonadota bacterium]MCG2751721.1 DUF58 domain-containing protein [Desulfobacteraceae bacterium]